MALTQLSGVDLSTLYCDTPMSLHWRHLRPARECTFSCVIATSRDKGGTKVQNDREVVLNVDTQNQILQKAVIVVYLVGVVWLQN